MLIDDEREGIFREETIYDVETVLLSGTRDDSSSYNRYLDEHLSHFFISKIGLDS